MADISKIKAMIQQKYGKESRLAKELGWTRQRLNKITNGKKEPDLEEVEALADKLEHPFSEVAYIFLNRKSPNDSQQAG